MRPPGKEGRSNSGNFSGLQDSVVKQLLAKIYGVKEASNIVVLGAILDPMHLQHNRLEVKLV